MAGEYTRCPHCECKVKISEVEDEDGICPECGQVVMESKFGKMFDEEPEDKDDMDEGYSDENEDEFMDDDNIQPDILDELNNEDDFPMDDDDVEENGDAPKRRRGGFGSSRRKKK